MYLYHSVKLKASLSLSSACKLARTTCICCMGPLLHTHPPALLCSALRKLSPPVGLCVSASHQTRLYHSKQAVRRMLPREKTVSAAHRAHTHCFGCRKKALPLPSVVLPSPQKTKCAWHPSVVMMSVLLCFVLSVILPPLPVLHLQACLSAWVEQLTSVKVKKNPC